MSIQTYDREATHHEALPHVGIQTPLFPPFPPKTRHAVSCGLAFPLTRGSLRERLQLGVEAELCGGHRVGPRLPREAGLETASVLPPRVNKPGMPRSLQ